MIRFRHVTAALAVAFTTLTAGIDPARAEEVHISLSDAIDRALGHHPDLAVAAFAPRRAAVEVDRQRGTFDPTLSVSVGYERDRLPGSPALGSYRDAAIAEARLAGRMRWGTEYALSYGTTRLETDAATAASNPTSSSFVELSVRQPLLRGFGSDVNLAGITVAQGQKRIADAQLARVTDAAIIETVDAYWRLVRAHRSLAVASESLELARRLAADTQSRVDAGALPPIELTQARASVAAREEAVIVGEAEVGKAGDALARLVQIDPASVFDVTLVPTEDPAGELPARSLGELIAIARRERADLVAAREAQTTAGVILRSASDRRRPDLSLVGSAGLGGLDRSWPASQGELAAEPDQHRLTAGLVFSMPIGNRSADGAYEDARLAVAEARQALRSLELQVEEDVRAAVRDLDASRKRVEATARAVELARAQLAAGEKRLATGLSTAFEVVRLQTDLSAAQNAEIAAQVAYRTALVRVDLATGTLWSRARSGSER